LQNVLLSALKPVSDGQGVLKISRRDFYIKLKQKSRTKYYLKINI
jgi:hypothetical protein